MNRALYPLLCGHVVYLDASFGQQLLTQVPLGMAGVEIFEPPVPCGKSLSG